MEPRHQGGAKARSVLCSGKVSTLRSMRVRADVIDSLLRAPRSSLCLIVAGHCRSCFVRVLSLPCGLLLGTADKEAQALHQVGQTRV